MLWARLAIAATALVASGCMGDAKPADRRGERADPPARPPAGWRTVRNDTAGFSVAVPRSWTARTKAGATVIRSRDRLVAVTVAADRSEFGRNRPPGDYARQVLERLPGFEGSISPEVRRVPGSPYASGRVEGTGSLSTARRGQAISVIAFRRPRRVTYSVIVFRNASFRGFDDRAVGRMLRTFRARPPA